MWFMIGILTMRRIHLLRHAKSSWDEPGLADRDRPLAPRGRKASALIAAHLREHSIRPDLVVCSSARRARETLDGIAPALCDAHVEMEGELYGAAAAELLERLRRLPDEVGSVMLIGHNPAVQELALMLAAPGESRDLLAGKFPTAALAALEVGGSAWAELQPGEAELIAYVRPRELR